jgi:phosphate starvation-inducible PhoH-like protein
VADLERTLAPSEVSTDLNEETTTIDLVLEPSDNERLANLCGQFDQNLRQIEASLHIGIANRGNEFHLSGARSELDNAARVVHELFDLAASESVSANAVHMALQTSVQRGDAAAEACEPVTIDTPRRRIRARGPNQNSYVEGMRGLDLNFGIGPAGTGKTYLAVAAAVAALDADAVRRIVLVRPAVEAGERLGFLPGDLAQKIDPYLRPMYDALYEMLGFERVGRLIDRSVIEVAPLAFMRGRTLNESFVILDEAQNTTIEQMKMFLTRIGFGSRAVVTGDITQTDLPRHRQSGLQHAAEVLSDTEGVRFTFFTSRDVVRHPLVQRVVEAYERAGPNDRDENRG